jgi:Cohesin domain
MLNGVIGTELKRRLLTALAILLPGLAPAAPTLSITSTSGAPGATVQLAVTLLTDTNVSSLQFDLRFNSQFLTAGDPEAGGAVADHVVASSGITEGTLRVALNSFSNLPLTNGVLVFIPLTIATNELLTRENLALTNVVLYNANTIPIHPFKSVNGSLTIAKLPHLTAASE